MRFLVDNMTCNHCKMRIEKALKDAGFKKVDINLETKTVTIELGKKTVEDAKLAVTKIGYNFQEL